MVSNEAHITSGFNAITFLFNGAVKSDWPNLLSSFVSLCVVLANFGAKRLFETDPTHKTECQTSLWCSGIHFGYDTCDQRYKTSDIGMLKGSGACWHGSQPQVDLS